MKLTRRLFHLITRIPAPVRAGQLVPHQPERELDRMQIAIEEETVRCILHSLRASDDGWQQYVLASMTGPSPPWWVQLWRGLRCSPSAAQDDDAYYQSMQ